MGIKAIARHLGIARNTVKSALRSTEPPAYRRQSPGSALDAVEADIRRLLAKTPDMAATVVAERIGWQRGMTILRERVAELRPDYLIPEGFGRSEYRPGELAQWDLWFPDYDIPVGHGQHARLPVMVGVSGYSRWISARMIASKETHDVLGGHLWCLEDLGAVPRLGVYDGEAAISHRDRGKVVFTEAFLRFRGTLAMGAIVLAPGCPERKGLVERANGYLETSFLSGRDFSSPQDFNAQLGEWLATKANTRLHAGLRCRPSDRIAEDLGAMMALPPVAPDVALHADTRLGRDHWVRVGTNDYSVHPRAIGRRVHVRADADHVEVTRGSEEVARHARVWARHVTVSDEAHDQARRSRTALAAMPYPAGEDDEGGDAEVATRDLADYDRALGLVG